MRAAGKWALLTLTQGSGQVMCQAHSNPLAELGFDFRAPPKGRMWGQWQAKEGPSFVRMPPSDLNKACGNAMDAHEAAQMHQNFSQQLLQDHIEACSLPEHNLITVRA